MEENKEERTVLITLEVPADVTGMKIVRRDMQGCESLEDVPWGMLRGVQSCVKSKEGENEKTDAE